MLYEWLSQKYKNLTLTVSSKILTSSDLFWTSNHVFSTSFNKKKLLIFVELFLFNTKESHFANFGLFSMDAPKKGVPNRQNLDIPFASPSSFIFTNLYLKLRRFRVISPNFSSRSSLYLYLYLYSKEIKKEKEFNGFFLNILLKEFDKSIKNFSENSFLS